MNPFEKRGIEPWYGSKEIAEMEDKKKQEIKTDKAQGGIFTTRVYSPGKNVEVTTVKDSKGDVKAVFVRDLFLGIF